MTEPSTGEKRTVSPSWTAYDFERIGAEEEEEEEAEGLEVSLTVCQAVINSPGLTGLAMWIVLLMILLRRGDGVVEPAGGSWGNMIAYSGGWSDAVGSRAKVLVLAPEDEPPANELVNSMARCSESMFFFAAHPLTYSTSAFVNSKLMSGRSYIVPAGRAR